LQKVGLFVKKDARACQKADEFEAWLKQRHVEVLRRESASPTLHQTEKNLACAPRDLFCVFVLGGDGTFLTAVRWIGNCDIPILGVKFGEVGFLAETVEERLFAAAEGILKNDFSLSSRIRLAVEVTSDSRPPVRETVLNDIVINKGALARLAYIQTQIDEDYLTTYRADGLIIATPTGSTAYSLAAGGPIVHPQVPGIVMTPICPFTLTNRPLILPESAEIKIRLEKGSSDIMLTFDGQHGLEINERDTIRVRKSDHPVQMINLPGQNYFDVLKEKLRWSGGRG
jgi:NAD+ kinase